MEVKSKKATVSLLCVLCVGEHLLLRPRRVLLQNEQPFINNTTTLDWFSIARPISYDITIALRMQPRHAKFKVCK